MLLKGKHILIVEDNSLNRVVYQISLCTQGALLEFDRWGHEAIHRLESSGHWDLIILDLMLPRGVSGFDIFRQIRAMPLYATTPIIAISAAEPALAIAQTRQLGFSGFISKPVDEELLPQQIAQVIMGEEIWYDGTLSR